MTMDKSVATQGAPSAAAPLRAIRTGGPRQVDRQLALAWIHPRKKAALCQVAVMMIAWSIGFVVLLRYPVVDIGKESKTIPSGASDMVLISWTSLVHGATSMFFGVSCMYNVVSLVFDRHANPDKWCLTMIVMLITLSCTLSYAAQARGLGPVVTGTNVPVNILMYWEWLCTTPLFIILICQMTGRDLPGGKPVSAHLIVDMGNIYFGLAAALAPRPWNWILLAASFGCYLKTQFSLYSIFRDAENECVLPSDNWLLWILEHLTYVVWALFPIVWVAGDQHWITADEAVITYAVVDVLAKSVYTLVIERGTFLTRSHVREVLDLANEEVLGNLKDLTRRMGVANALVEALASQADAENANTLQRTFISNISHELRTPLNAVIAFTNLALDLEMDDEKAEYLRCSLTAAEALLAVINQILEYSRFESGVEIKMRNEVFCLQDVCSEVQDITAGRRLDAGVDVVVIPEAIETLEDQLVGDTFSLRQVLVNLCDNAIKFSPEGGLVELRLQRDRARDSAHQVGVKFLVRDSGIGITAEGAQRLFRPFSQVSSSNKRLYPGTGLGLVIVRRIVNLMGGDVNFVPRRDGEPAGATFEVSVPLYRPHTLPKHITLDGDTRVTPGALPREKDKLSGMQVLLGIPSDAVALSISTHLAYWGATVGQSKAARDFAFHTTKLSDAAPDEVDGHLEGACEALESLGREGICLRPWAVVVTFKTAQLLFASPACTGQDVLIPDHVIVLIGLSEKRGYNRSSIRNGDTEDDRPLRAAMKGALTRPLKADALLRRLKQIAVRRHHALPGQQQQTTSAANARSAVRRRSRGMSAEHGSVGSPGSTVHEYSPSPSAYGTPPGRAEARREDGMGTGLGMSPEALEGMGDERRRRITDGEQSGTSACRGDGGAQRPSVSTPAASPGGAEDAHLLRGARCLLVEDNLVNQKVAAAMCKGIGLAVTIAGNGKIGLELLQSEVEPFSLVLMDVQMPVMDGLEATRAIRERERAGTLGPAYPSSSPRIPIIAMTANVSTNDRDACLRSGMDDYISKPVYPAKLKEKILKFCAAPITPTTPAHDRVVE